MTPPAAVIVNPSSSGKTATETLAAVLMEHGIDATLSIVTRGADITALARSLYQSGYRTLIAAGGDGTVRAIAAAIVDTDAVLGVLPLGGLNHFARDLGVPPDLSSAVRILAGGTTCAVDVAEVNGHLFLNNSGLGLYPSLVAKREKWRRLGQRKWIAFFRAALATLRRFPFVDVQLTAEGQAFERRTPFVFVGNNTYRMEGFNLGSRESLTGGLLCLAVAQYRMGRMGLVRLAFRALFGRIRNERDLDILQPREIHITSRRRRVSVSLDGEVMVIETPLRYRIRPGALRVIAP